MTSTTSVKVDVLPSANVTVATDVTGAVLDDERTSSVKVDVLPSANVTVAVLNNVDGSASVDVVTRVPPVIVVVVRTVLVVVRGSAGSSGSMVLVTMTVEVEQDGSSIGGG